MHVGMINLFQVEINKLYLYIGIKNEIVLFYIVYNVIDDVFQIFSFNIKR